VPGSHDEELLREARVVGIRDRVRPSLAAVDQRRSQLLLVVCLVMLALALAFLFLLSSTDRAVGAAELTRVPAFRASPFLLVMGLIWYVAEKERHLRRLTQLLLADRAVMAELAHAARHDPLTGLLNRTAFVDRLDDSLARAARHHRRVAVVFTDLDQFKAINDTWGHQVGDTVLVEVAERLRTVVRTEDCVARFAGDEFMVLAEDLGSPEDALVLAARVKEALSMTLPVDGKELPITSSTGVAYSEHGSTSSFELLMQADVAMYVAKANEPGGYMLFEPSFLARPGRDAVRA
jgi:diguanylate cyclase (GGDEF)-like protein